MGLSVTKFKLTLFASPEGMTGTPIMAFPWDGFHAIPLHYEAKERWRKLLNPIDLYSSPQTPLFSSCNQRSCFPSRASRFINLSVARYLEIHDAGKRCRIERCAADQRAIDFRLRHQRLHVVRLH